MIPKAHGCRGSIGATVRYFEREKAPGRGRVADVGFVELPPGVTLDTASRIMAATAREQAKIKELRGISARGRPTHNPYYHFSLSWHPEEHPTRPEVEQAVDGALKSLDLEGHQAIWVAHADTQHYHAHVAVSRIAWETGRTVRMSNDRRKLSAWALAYEKAQGEVRVETRVRREAWRSRGRDLVELQQVARGLGNTIAVSHLGRQMAEHHQARPRAEHSRGPGREARTDEDYQEWASHFACQRAQPDTDPDALRRARIARSRKQRRRRRLKIAVAQAGDVVGRAGAAVGRVSRVGKAIAGVAGAGVVSGAVEIVGAAARAARVAKDVGTLGVLVVVIGGAKVVQVGIGGASKALVMQKMRGVLSERPALRAALRAERLSARRELGAAAGTRYHSEPWSTDRVDDLRHYLGGRVPATYQEPVGLLAALEQMRWVVPGPSASARATPAARTGASQPASRINDRRVDGRSEARALSTRARTEPQPPPERPGSAREAAGVKNKARGISRN